jgi:hypothetical protein
MSKTRIVSTIAGMLIIAISFSSCVYHSRGPAYDYGYNGGYGYGYRYRVPPPRPIVVVPSTPPHARYRDRGYRHGRSNRDYNRQNYRQYGHNGRPGGRY